MGGAYWFPSIIWENKRCQNSGTKVVKMKIQSDLILSILHSSAAKYCIVSPWDHVNNSMDTFQRTLKYYLQLHKWHNAVLCPLPSSLRRPHPKTTFQGHVLLDQSYILSNLLGRIPWFVGVLRLIRTKQQIRSRVSMVILNFSATTNLCSNSCSQKSHDLDRAVIWLGCSNSFVWPKEDSYLPNTGFWTLQSWIL